MNNKSYRRYWLLSLCGVLAACAYPMYMGVKVIAKMQVLGAVPVEDYPKYVIPYAPIALAVILGVLLLPLMQKLFRKLDLLFGTGVSLGAFFIAERLMETKILVQTQELVPMESWQMSLCYTPPELYKTRTWEAVDILLGGYSPAFKLHFYMISVIVIVTLLNGFYGFGKIIRTGDTGRKKALTVQSAAGVAFLGMCIWACFTAFYRTGELTVPPVSAVLMAVFFILMGVTAGTFIGSFTLGKRKLYSAAFPALCGALFTALMYAGEMILLSGNLYRFGTGFFFEGLGALVLAPADILVILASGALTLLICLRLNRRQPPPETA